MLPVCSLYANHAETALWPTSTAISCGPSQSSAQIMGMLLQKVN